MDTKEHYVNASRVLLKVFAAFILQYCRFYWSSVWKSFGPARFHRETFGARSCSTDRCFGSMKTNQSIRR